MMNVLWVILLASARRSVWKMRSIGDNLLAAGLEAAVAGNRFGTYSAAVLEACVLAIREERLVLDRRPRPQRAATQSLDTLTRAVRPL